MPTTIIRVTRTQTVKVTEYVDVPVHHDKGDANYTIESAAKGLVEAQLAAGHVPNWAIVKSEPESWSVIIKATEADEALEEPVEQPPPSAAPAEDDLPF